MKICIISHALHPYSEKSKKFQHSSVNDVLLNLSHGFKDLGHDVFLILKHIIGIYYLFLSIKSFYRYISKLNINLFINYDF